MTPRYIYSFILSALLFGTVTIAAETRTQSAIVKGTITIAGKATSDVVVSIEGVRPESFKSQLASLKSKKAVIDQREQKFIPTTLAVVVGTRVEFPNNDKVWHNVYSTGGVKNFDLGLYPSGQSRSVTFDTPGVARILCNAHPNMEAFIVVKEHPFFSTADNRGNYRIDGIPLGSYRVTVWHPELGITDAGVELVRAGQVSDIDFDLKKK
jgi:plastocyanin